MIAAALNSSAPLDLDQYRLAGAPSGSYQWWYFDALSDDGRFGVVAIFFVGGVFSALYADRLAAGVPASPLDHPMVNLVVYERGKKRAWVFSEYPRESLELADPYLDLAIGRTRLRRLPNGSYEWQVRDRDFPARRDIDARAVFHPLEPALSLPDAKLSSDGKHLWGAAAPHCRVEFSCAALGISWQGNGYHDMNAGFEPLHQGFREWGWGRTQLGDETRIYYDAVEASGARVRNTLVGKHGQLGFTSLRVPLGAPDERETTAWLLRLPRTPDVGQHEGRPIQVARETMWEHSPFYARWVSRFSTASLQSRGVCEHVDLTRFAQPLIRFMLRYRIYRRRADGGVYPAQVRRQEVFPHDP